MKEKSMSLFKRVQLYQSSAWIETLRINGYTSLTLKITLFTPHDSVLLAGMKKREEAVRSLAGRGDSRLNLEIPAGVFFLLTCKKLTAQLAGDQLFLKLVSQVQG